jgi:hypothetical protein
MWALSWPNGSRPRTAGQFTLGEMLRWARPARAPAGEIPLIDGEFFFIAALTADTGWQRCGGPG